MARNGSPRSWSRAGLAAEQADNIYEHLRNLAPNFSYVGNAAGDTITVRA